MVRVATFRPVLDLVDPPCLIELSGEREENPAHQRGVQKGTNKMTAMRGVEGSPIPISVVHHAFLELGEERLKLLFGHGHRGCSPSVAVTKDARQG